MSNKYSDMRDLFADNASKIRLLQSRNVPLARLDQYQIKEKLFNQAVAKAQKQENTTLLANAASKQNTTPHANTKTNSLLTVANETLTSPTDNPKIPSQFNYPDTHSYSYPLSSPLTTHSTNNLTLPTTTSIVPDNAQKVNVYFGKDVISEPALTNVTPQTLSQTNSTPTNTTLHSDTASLTQVSANTKKFVPVNVDAVTTQNQTNEITEPKVLQNNRKIYFDARHVYASVLERFGVDVNLIMNVNPDSYSAQNLYASSLLNANNFDALSLSQKMKTYNIHSPKKQLAALYISPNDEESTSDTLFKGIASTNTPEKLNEYNRSVLSDIRKSLNHPNSNTTTTVPATATTQHSNSINDNPEEHMSVARRISQRILEHLKNNDDNTELTARQNHLKSTTGIPLENQDVLSQKSPSPQPDNNLNLQSSHSTTSTQATQATQTNQPTSISETQKLSMHSPNTNTNQPTVLLNDDNAYNVISEPIPNSSPQQDLTSKMENALARFQNRKGISNS